MITKYGFKALRISSSNEKYNFLFIPGGPGLGRKYLESFCQKIELPGDKYLGDFPRDGDNNHGELSIKNWKNSLLDICKELKNVILVTHSFSGMFTLSISELEKDIAGLVLMNTTTRQTFFESIEQSKIEYFLPDLESPLIQYHNSPSKEEFKNFWNTYKHYCFTEAEFQQSDEILETFSFNNDSYNMIVNEFFPTYKASWVPTKIPALTIASELDFICPKSIFVEDNKYDRDNIMNVVIPDSGHLPWILNLETLQKHFDTFCSKFLI